MSDFRERVPNISSLASMLGNDYSHIHAVLRGATPAGYRLAIAIEDATAGAISRTDLRPDIWPPALVAAPLGKVS